MSPIANSCNYKNTYQHHIVTDMLWLVILTEAQKDQAYKTHHQELLLLENVCLVQINAIVNLKDGFSQVVPLRALSLLMIMNQIPGERDQGGHDMAWTC